MNAKVCKALRRSARRRFANPVVTYNDSRPPVYIRLGLNEHGEMVPMADGTTIVKTERGIPCTLLNETQRGFYQHMKRHLKRAGF